MTNDLSTHKALLYGSVIEPIIVSSISLCRWRKAKTYNGGADS